MASSDSAIVVSMQYNQITTKIKSSTNHFLIQCIYFKYIELTIVFYFNVICFIFFIFSDIFKSNNILDNFQQLLDNVFLPLFEATNDPNTHPDLHRYIINK